FSSFVFSNDPDTTEIYTLSLHDALPISSPAGVNTHVSAQPTPQRLLDPTPFRRERPCLPAPTRRAGVDPYSGFDFANRPAVRRRDRKSTRLNSSHVSISYAVFCLKKKNK